MKSGRAAKIKAMAKSKKVAKKPAKPAAKAKAAKKLSPKPPKLKPVKVDPKVLKAQLKAKELEKKQEESSKKAFLNPWDAFFGLWKPKTDTFDMGLDKFFETYKAPVKEAAALKDSVREKLLQSMRRHPLSPAIEEQLFERFPRDRVHKIGSIFSVKPRTTIRLNFLRADLKAFTDSQLAQDLKIKRSQMSPWAYEVGKPEDLPKHPSFGKGLYEVQDEGSQWLALLVNSRPGHRILALNAGTGQTALAIASMMKNSGSLFVYESDPKNIKAFKESATKIPLDNYRILSDAQIGEVKSLDSVLIEAPCSGLGMIGLSPELKWRFQKEDLVRLHKLQAALLREAGRKLKLGGYIIYATRTLNKSENEQQVDHFIRSSHNSFRVVNVSTHLKEFVLPYVSSFFNFQLDEKTLTGLLEYDPFFFLSPDVHGTPGLFVSIIQRTRIST